MSRRSVPGGSQSSARGRRLPRIHGPRNFKDEYARGHLKAENRPVLAKIERCYDHSRLKYLDGEFICDGGFCFGLLDPTSNIVVNSVITSSARRPEGGGGRSSARRQEDGQGYTPITAFVKYEDCWNQGIREIEVKGQETEIFIQESIAGDGSEVNLEEDDVWTTRISCEILRLKNNARGW